MNIDHAVIKAYEGKSLKEIAKSPVHALQGVSENDAKLLKEAFGIDTVEELGTNKFFLMAQAIVNLAKFEG